MDDTVAILPVPERDLAVRALEEHLDGLWMEEKDDRLPRQPQPKRIAILQSDFPDQLTTACPTMEFGSTAKVLTECKLEYYRISVCALASTHCAYIMQSQIRGCADPLLNRMLLKGEGQSHQQAR